MLQTGNLYADLAGYYDRFCADVDYAGQCAFTQRAFTCFSSSGGRDYLDLACGTGQHLLHMSHYGFVVSGLDNSRDMLAQAAQRVPQAELLLCDLAAFDQMEAFDLISCFLYSIHYSHPTTALEETLHRAWRALKPGGVFIFNAVDAAGIAASRTIQTRVTEGDSELRFRSGWHYSGSGDVLELVLGITRTSGSSRESWHDRHTMTAIRFTQLQRLLQATGFKVTFLEHDYDAMRPWDGTSFNAIVVAAKAGGLPSGTAKPSHPSARPEPAALP